MKGRFFNWLITLLALVGVTGFCFTLAFADDLDPFAELQLVGEEVIIPAEEEDVDIDHESFGTNYQYTWVSAFDFVPMSSATPINFSSYYRYTSGGENIMLAPLRLPSGAILTSARMYYYDASSSNIFMRIYRLSLFTTVLELCRCDSMASNGYGYSTCTLDSLTPKTIANANNLYYIYVAFGGGGSGNCKLAGVRLVWGRQVHTGLPHPFTDLGDQTSYFRDCIAALYQSGITSGTSATTYSPNANVTRGQMAVFLAKALGLYWDGWDGY